MNDAQKAQAVEDYLSILHDRAVESLTGGNQLGSAYLAEICGMWGACLKNRQNRFDKDDVWLYRWFANGIEDFDRAVFAHMQAQKAAAKAKEEAKAKAKKGKGFRLF